MTLQTFAEKFRLRIREDECGDPIIPGKRGGHLYWDDGLCAMWIDARPINRSRMAELGGKMWQGDISPDAKGKRVQDAKVIGIDPVKYRLAIRLAGVKAKQIMSPARKAVLEAARAKSPIGKPREQKHSPAVESPGDV